MLYPEDVPSDVSVVAAPESAEVPEVAAEAEAEVAAMGGESGSDSAPGPSIRRLRSIPAHPEAELAEPLAVRRRRRPQLRLVK